MDDKKASVWTSIRFWKRSAAWVTGMSVVLLMILTFNTMGQISMGSDEDLKNGIKRRVPSPSVINYKISYKYDEKRGIEVPVIGEKELLFGKEFSPTEAKELLHLGKLTFQSKNCIDCHTILGNGSYYAPDLTKAWLDPKWNDGTMAGITGAQTKEEAMVKFLMDPKSYATHERMMPNLGITKKEAMALVAFLKHTSAIDTNGFPRNFSQASKRLEGGTNAR